MFRKYKLFKQKHLRLGAKRPGQVLILAFIFLFLVLLLSATLFTQTTNFLRFSTKSLDSEIASNAADAALDLAQWKLNQAGYTNYTGETNTTLTNGKSTFTIKVELVGVNTKKITATGYVPNNVAPRTTRTVTAQTKFTPVETIGFSHAVQVGSSIGMSSNSRINGSAYAGSFISGSDSSAVITGTAYTPSIFGPSYGAWINCWPCVPVPDIPTTSQYQDTADKPENLKTCPGGPTSTFVINSSATIGPAKYPCNLEIQGNVTVNIAGPIHVTGNFTTEWNKFPIIQPASSLPVGVGTFFIVDGWTNIGYGAHIYASGSAGNYGYLLFIQPGATVSQPGYNSVFYIAAIDAKAIFYTKYGKVVFSQNNFTMGIGAVYAGSLELGQYVQVAFDTGLPTETFTGGGGVWQFTKGSYQAISTPPGALTAVFDAAIHAPVCATIGISCTANVQGVAGGEVNSPNTISQCAEFGGDPIQQLKVFTADQTPFKVGNPVTFEVTVDNWNDGGESFIDFWYTPGSVNSGWLYKGSVGFAGYDGPPDYGANLTRSVTFNLAGSPAGLHTVHANYRDHNYTGPPPIPHCTYSDGPTPRDDHDDVVFKVGS